VRRDRVERARALARSIGETGEGWCVSNPNDKELRLEIIPGSALIDVLAEKYRLIKGGKSTRIVNNAIVAEVIGKNGQVIRQTIHHGEIEVDVYFLELPE
jgi:hypothetical protein